MRSTKEIIDELVQEHMNAQSDEVMWTPTVFKEAADRLQELCRIVEEAARLIDGDDDG